MIAVPPEIIVGLVTMAALIVVVLVARFIDREPQS